MNSKHLNIFKNLLFVLGLVIIAIAFAVVNSPMPEQGLTSGQKFLWVEIVICYLVFFIPFFFSSISSKNIDTKITSTIAIWISVIIFEIIAIALAVLSLNDVVKIKVSIIVELIVFFISAIFVYFGCFSGNHIGNVQEQEKQSLNKIKELKSAFEILNLKTQMWPDELNAQKAAVKKLCDDVRYISPLESDAASKIEMKLIVAANVIMESNLSSAEMDSRILELTNLISQRKLLKN